MPKPLVCAQPWFAWRPVKTTNKRIAWLRILIRHRHIPHDPLYKDWEYWEYINPADITYTERPHA